MSAAESSILLNGMLPSVTTAANLVADKTIEFLKQQQEQLQRQLLKQEILNTNLYQSLIDSGVIPAVRTTTSSSTSNLLELLKNRSLLRGGGNENGNGGSGSGGTSSSSSPFNSAPNLANLASILPLSEAFTSLGTVFEKLFGTKFWIYILFALLIGTGFMILSCLVMYCCCCNRVGKVLCCCRFSSWFKKSSSSSSKKSKKKQALEDASKIKCCV